MMKKKIFLDIEIEIHIIFLLINFINYSFIINKKKKT